MPGQLAGRVEAYDRTRASADMNADPRSDAVARQYDRWRYPFPIEDLDAWLAGNWEWFDPSHAHRILWPDRPYQPDLDILIAGCGTNQAAVFAYQNRNARVVAVDVSRSSLDHEDHLRRRYGLTNLTLHELAIEEVPALGLTFDLVVSTGVLHHLANPLDGMKALAACARPDAAMAVMLYAKYGRLGVDLLASVFQDMGLGQDETSVAMVHEALGLLPQNHPVHSYLSIASDMGSDAALVDTFLHARAEAYTVDECLELVDAAGLVFQSWLFNAPYHLHDVPPSPKGIAAALAALPDARHWSVMERLYPSNACHFFIACRPERPRSSYTIDFAPDRFLEYVPTLRHGCGLAGAELYRPDWRLRLDATQHALVHQVDGHRSLWEIAASPGAHGAAARTDLADAERCRELFRALWRLDFLSMGLPQSRGGAG